MPEDRHAILIGCSEFPKAPGELAKLRCPENDVEGMHEILTARPWGLFAERQTHIVKNKSHNEILFKIEEVLKSAAKDDMIVIYYSGHGRCDDHGWLYLAAANTDTRYLGSTSIPAQLIKSYIDNCASSKVVLILDCCFSGAVGKVFLRGGGVDGELRHIADGRGTFILTASTKLQTAREREGDRYGLLTKHIIYGVQEREADADGDGLVSINELYKYVHQRVKEEGPQEPQLIVPEARGDLYLARTGILPRKDRERKLKDLLFDLNRRAILADEIMMRAIGIASQSNAELFGENRRYDELLDRLLHQQVDVGEFYTQWYQIGSGSRPVALHSPPATLPDRPVHQPAGSERALACELSRTLPRNPSGVLCLAFSPGGSYLAVGDGEGKVQIWEVRSGALKKEFAGGEGSVWSVAFTPDGQCVTAAGADGIIRAWDFISSTPLLCLTGHNRPIASLNVSTRGDLIASGSYDGTVKIWNAKSGLLKWTLDSDAGPVKTVAFHVDGELVAAGARGAIRIWDVLTGQLSNSLSNHRGDVNSIAFSAGGRYFASGGKDSMVRLWETSRWLLKRSFRCESYPVLSLAFSNDERLVAVGSSDGVIRIWDTASCELVCSLDAGHISVHAVSFSPDNRFIASAGTDETVRLWNYNRPVRRLSQAGG